VRACRAWEKPNAAGPTRSVRKLRLRLGRAMVIAQ
jgi:hypothetical protein